MTEPAGDTLTDPVAAVVAVVTMVDPAVDQDTVRAAVQRAGGPGAAAWPQRWPPTRRC